MSRHTLPPLPTMGSISGVQSQNVEVEPVSISLSNQEMQDLHATVQPLRNSNSWGVDIYLEAVAFLEALN